MRRDRLSERLRQAKHVKVTLISAPPGFGKTTLLAAWLASASDGLIPVWVALDPTDNESSRLLVQCRHGVPPGGADRGSRPSPMLEGSPPPPAEMVVTSLANEIGSVGVDVVLVLDDFHVIEASDVLAQVSYLFECLPPSGARRDHDARRSGPSAGASSGARATR